MCESQAKGEAAGDVRAVTPEIAQVLVSHHRRFLSFLQARVESRAVAEEILQDAFVKGVEKSGQLREEESAVAWFYRLLRNAVVDHYRRRGAENRALEKELGEAMARPGVVETELEQTVCGCVSDLIPTLKPDFEAMVRAVDLEGRSVTDVAGELGITAGAARVRLHRARQALKLRLEQSCSTCAEHGCLDCTCDAASP